MARNQGAYISSIKETHYSQGYAYQRDDQVKANDLRGGKRDESQSPIRYDDILAVNFVRTGLHAGNVCCPHCVLDGRFDFGSPSIAAFFLASFSTSCDRHQAKDKQMPISFNSMSCGDFVPLCGNPTYA
jgi:hypothetical protein